VSARPHFGTRAVTAGAWTALPQHAGRTRRARRRRRAGGDPTPTVSETPRDRADVDACRDQLGGRVVPEAVEVRLDSEPAHHSGVPLADAARDEMGRQSGASEKTKASGNKATPQRCCLFGGPLEVLTQNGDGLRIERHPPLLVGLGVLLQELKAELRDRPAVGEHAVVQLDIRPSQRAELAASRAGRHREPDQRSPIGVGPGLLQYTGGFLG
jgi:hypothetical protein